MITRLSLVLVGLGLWAGQAVAQKTEATVTPTVVLRLRSIDGLIADVKYLAESAGHTKEAGDFDQSIKQALPNGFEGIDTKRPIGLYGILDPAGSLPDSTVVLLVPVSDEKAFLGLFERFGIQMEKDGDVHSFTPPNSPFPVFFRFANKYAYATIRDKKFIDLDRLPKPETIVPADQADSIALSFRIDLIPHGLKQIALGQLELQASAEEEKKIDGESDAQHAARLAGAKIAAKESARLLEEGSEVSLRFNVDRTAGSIRAEFNLTGKPGSTLATEIAKVGTEPSQFAAMDRPDAAATVLLHATLSEEIRDVWVKGFREGFNKALAENKDKDDKSLELGQKLLKVLEPAMKAGVFDLGVSVRAPGTKGHLTFVAGMQLKEGKQLEAVLLDAIKTMQPAGKPEVKFSTQTINGVTVHEFDPGEEPEAEKILGTTKGYLAFRDNAVYFAGGEDGLAALKEALAAAPGKSPPFKVEVSMARIAPFIKPADKSNPVEAASQAFPKGKEGSDKILLVMEGGSRFSLRMQIQTAVLKFFGILEEQKKRE
jgi:hypothetical protein